MLIKQPNHFLKFTLSETALTDNRQTSPQWIIPILHQNNVLYKYKIAATVNKSTTAATRISYVFFNYFNALLLFLCIS